VLAGPGEKEEKKGKGGLFAGEREREKKEGKGRLPPVMPSGKNKERGNYIKIQKRQGEEKGLRQIGIKKKHKTLCSSCP